MASVAMRIILLNVVISTSIVAADTILEYSVYELDTEGQNKYPWSRSGFVGNWFGYFSDARNISNTTKKYLSDTGFDPEHLLGAGFYAALDGIEEPTEVPSNKSTFPAINFKTQGDIIEILLIYYVHGNSELRITFEPTANAEEIDPCKDQKIEQFEALSTSLDTSKFGKDANSGFRKICSYHPESEKRNKSANIILKSWNATDFILLDLVRITGNFSVALPTTTTTHRPPTSTTTSSPTTNATSEIPVTTVKPTTTSVPTTTTPSPADSGGQNGWTIFGIIFTTLLVIGLMVGGFILVRRRRLRIPGFYYGRMDMDEGNDDI